MSVIRDIFRAIHERKWLSIEYRNKRRETTRYWIGIEDVDPRNRRITAQGMHLGTYELADLTILIDSILSSSLVENSYFNTPVRLIDDIAMNEERYVTIFGATPNLKVLDYLADCNRLNAVPTTKNFGLIDRIDEDSFKHGAVRLSDSQFKDVVKRMQGKTRPASDAKVFASNERIAMNVLSVHTKAGLYVLAYRELRLDVAYRSLAIGRNTVFCREFSVRNGRAEEHQSIRRFIDDDELSLLEDFSSNREVVKDRIAQRIGESELVDDEPHVFVIARDMAVNLQPEYDAICEMCANGEETVPVQAFFGKLTKRPIRRKDYPMAIIDRRINLDQLLASHQALKYPLTYVQGPPGTGKTTTIVNILVNILLSGRTVLFASFNNHPVDGVMETLSKLRYDGRPLPFPVLRLGDRNRTLRALDLMKELYLAVKDEPLLDGAIELEQAEQRQRSKALSKLLGEYEERLDLQERRECIEKLAETTDDFSFGIELQGRQLIEVEDRLGQIEPTETVLAHAMDLTNANVDEVSEHLYRLSVRHLKRLGDGRAAELREIVMSSAPAKERVSAFNQFVSSTANLKTLLRIFPVIATTCISARRLGLPEPTFDLTVIDEASQCDTACALIPIVRGRNLALVGDPQQLRPVVTIDPVDNAALRRTYCITDEYDFIENSAYKAFLACDSVSNEILLRQHYRRDESIIDFSNRKYYNGKLDVRSGRKAAGALSYQCVELAPSSTKNTAPVEADAVVEWVQNHQGVSIGVITPFTAQRDYLLALLEERGESDVPCGTVHAFQGDEKDVILFSLALTERTTPATYAWLANNRELINVATSRPRDRLVVFSNDHELERLHASMNGQDDIYELVQYVKSNGASDITPRTAMSRALGIKPYSTKTENAFLENLNHALGNIFTSGTRHVVHREVPVAHVFGESSAQEQLFYSGRFDFVVYEVSPDKVEIPLLAIELDGKEHRTDEAVAARDAKKNEICKRHDLELIRVENTYARRYHHIKEILESFFLVR